MALSLSTKTRTSMMQGGVTGLNYLKVYANPRPTPDDEPVGTLLAVFSFPGNFTPVDGQAWTNGPLTVNALATGTATWGRWSSSGDAPGNPYDSWIDGSVGIEACDFKLDTVDFVVGEAVQFISLRVTLPSE